MALSGAWLWLPSSMKKVGVREMLKSAIKSIRWKVTLKRIFASKERFPET